jgi:hypothetical protein
MHPWEDFAETFAHYLHIVGTLQTAAAIGIRLDAGASTLRDTDVVPRDDYRDEPIGRVLADWAALSQGFNRVNRSMGLGDLYPFTITQPCSASSRSCTRSSHEHRSRPSSRWRSPSLRATRRREPGVSPRRGSRSPVMSGAALFGRGRDESA